MESGHTAIVTHPLPQEWPVARQIEGMLLADLSSYDQHFQVSYFWQSPSSQPCQVSSATITFKPFTAFTAIEAFKVVVAADFIDSFNRLLPHLLHRNLHVAVIDASISRPDIQHPPRLPPEVHHLHLQFTGLLQ